MKLILLVSILFGALGFCSNYTVVQHTKHHASHHYAEKRHVTVQHRDSAIRTNDTYYVDSQGRWTWLGPDPQVHVSPAPTAPPEPDQEAKPVKTPTPKPKYVF